ncbi:MAG: phosphatidate cytidylyltransferase [Bryobacteraceae bacterium]
MKRVLTAAVLLPVVTYIVLWSPPSLFLAVLAVVGAFCYYEYSGIVAAHSLPRPGPLGYAAGLLVLVAPTQEFALITLVGVLALSLALRSEPLSTTLPLAGAILLGVIYIFGAWRCAAALRAIDPWWLFFALSLNWIGDSAAFYFGRALGRHRLAPRVSPGKSWEGTIASVIASTVYGAVLLYYVLPHFALVNTVVLSAAGNIAGQAGDLAESAMKRGAGLKDSGTLLPGHGGWLDRVDSSLFSIPVVYVLLSFAFSA